MSDADPSFESMVQRDVRHSRRRALRRHDRPAPCQLRQISEGRASDAVARDASGDGVVPGVETAEGDGPGAPTPDRLARREHVHGAADEQHADDGGRRDAGGLVIVGNLHGTGESRSCGVVSIRRRAASTARSGAWVGPASIHDRAARSSERSSVMRDVLR